MKMLFDGLNQRERAILKLRHEENKTFSEIAKIYKITPVMIRHIHDRVIGRMVRLYLANPQGGTK